MNKIATKYLSSAVLGLEKKSVKMTVTRKFMLKPRQKNI